MINATVEKRQFPRVNAKLPLRIAGSLLGETLDLSESGIRFVIDRPLSPTETRAMIEVSPEDSIDTEFKIAWDRHLAEEDKFAYGVSFKGLEEDDIAILRRVLYRRKRFTAVSSIINTLQANVEDFWYKKILRNMLSLSRLGKTSMAGDADSGLNFDHMYRNQAAGVNLFGKLVDRILLNLPSVQATRNRKEIIIKILQNEIANNLLLNRKTKILDIASGPARYLSELMSNYKQSEIEVLCVDKDKRSLDLGRVLAGSRPIRYAKADILRTAHLKRLSGKISWMPNIVLISGLFEYKDDIFVKHILKEIYDNIDNDGLFLFISQADNPSKKLMSKVGLTSEGKNWELIYRQPQTFRRWLIDTGFKNIVISVDRWGMYEFCTCRR